MIYRWERDTETYDRDGGMVLRPDDDRPQDDDYSVALYWHAPNAGVWEWADMDTGRWGTCASADGARRACELAVLHDKETT